MKIHLKLYNLIGNQNNITNQNAYMQWVKYQQKNSNNNQIFY